MAYAALTSAAQSELGYQDQERQGYCASAVQSFCRHMHDPDLPPLPMGASNREYRRAKKERLKALKAKMAGDVAGDFGLDKKETVGLIAGILLLIFGGPIFVVCAVVAAVAEWALEGWLDKKFPPQAYSAAGDDSRPAVQPLLALPAGASARSWQVHFMLWAGWLRHSLLGGWGK